MVRTNTHYIQIWYLLNDTLNDLWKNRKVIEASPHKHEFKIAAINSSMLIHIAAIVEGAVNSLLTIMLEDSDNFKKAKNKDEHELIRIYDSLLNSLQKATWNDLSENYSNIILGFKLSDNLYKDWEAIKCLFQFRNLLAHGGLIIKRTKMSSTAKSILEIENVEELYEESITRESLFEYLASKGLNSSPRGTNEFVKWGIINSPVIDFFWVHAKEFLIEVYEKSLDGGFKNKFLHNDLKYLKSEFCSIPYSPLSVVFNK
jgi:hypothetical protein